jgi:hypothetical protein
MSHRRLVDSGGDACRTLPGAREYVDPAEVVVLATPRLPLTIRATPRQPAGNVFWETRPSF